MDRRQRDPKLPTGHTLGSSFNVFEVKDLFELFSFFFFFSLALLLYFNGSSWELLGVVSF